MIEEEDWTKPLTDDQSPRNSTTQAFTLRVARWRNIAKICASPARISAGLKTERRRPVKQTARREARQLVILTGLSGSGKSTVSRPSKTWASTTVDNLPAI